MSSRNRHPLGRRFFAPGAENSAPLHARVQGPPPAAPLGRDGIMNQTENYQLSLWDPEDRIQRTDFNADNAKIEAALAGHAAALAGCGNCKIESFSYMGTGTYGASSPKIISFTKKPVFLLIRSASSLFFCTPEDDTATFLGLLSSITIGSCPTVWMGATLSFYSGSVIVQMNQQDVSYRVIAFYAEDQE